MSIDKLSLEGLDFQATKINIKNNILTITLNRPEKKKCIKQCDGKRAKLCFSLRQTRKRN